MRDALPSLRRTLTPLVENAATLTRAALSRLQSHGGGGLPRYGVATRTLIDNCSADFDGLSVTFKGMPADTLSVSHVYVWNEGRERLRGADLAAADPITVAVINGETFLDASVLHRSDPSSSVALRRVPGAQAATLGFDVLGANQGCIVRVLHTGYASDITVSGAAAAGFGPVDHPATGGVRVWIALGAAASCMFAIGFAMAALVRAVPDPSLVLVYGVYTLGLVIALIVSRTALRLLARRGGRTGFDGGMIHALEQGYLRRRVFEPAGGAAMGLESPPPPAASERPAPSGALHRLPLSPGRRGAAGGDANGDGGRYPPPPRRRAS